MGAWGCLPFENDDALDWLDELEGGGAEVLRGALTKANNGHIEAPDGSIAIAAADITASCQGNPPGDLPENVADWVTAHGAEITAEDAELALEAVGRVAGEEPNWPSCGMTPRTPNGDSPSKTFQSGCAQPSGRRRPPGPL